MPVSPLRRESFSECADGNQPIRFSFSAFSLSEKRFRERYFLIRLSNSRECRLSFRKKSLIILSSKREKSVEYRVRGTFPEKKFPPSGCKTWKKCGIQGEEVFWKTFRSNHRKVWNIGWEDFPWKKVPTDGLSNPKKVWNTGWGEKFLRVHWQPNKGIPR